MHRNIVVFEVEGGSDKFIHGHRRDTMPIVEVIRARGWGAEVVYYRPEWAEALYAYVSGNFDGYISRVNPGNVPGGERGYFALLSRLSGEAGLTGMSTPDEMMAYGAKDSLVKLRGTGLVPDDTAAYYGAAEFRRAFPVSLSRGERVLKQNRGSTGSGIWRVRVAGEAAAETAPGTCLPTDTALVCTEAVDNHTEHRTLGDFMGFCERYVEGDGGMLVDMRFMPRIVEGEIRILLVGSRPVFVVHKKPAAGGENFSATLFSGATYTYDEPGEWPGLIEEFEGARPVIAERLGGGGDVPLLWTADFMLDDAPGGGDAYVLGEINCSCVGFTSELHMGIQDLVAEEAIRRIAAKHDPAEYSVEPADLARKALKTTGAGEEAVAGV